MSCRMRSWTEGVSGLLYPLFLLIAAPLPRLTSSPTYRVSGVVLDTGRAPVPDAEVSLIEAGTVRRRVASDATGRFTFEDCSAPRIVIRVRRLGYKARMLEVAPAGSEATLVEIVLADVPAELAEIVVRPRPSPRLRELYERKGQGRGFARCLEY